MVIFTSVWLSSPMVSQWPSVSARSGPGHELSRPTRRRRSRPATAPPAVAQEPTWNRCDVAFWKRRGSGRNIQKCHVGFPLSFWFPCPEFLVRTSWVSSSFPWGDQWGLVDPVDPCQILGCGWRYPPVALLAVPHISHQVKTIPNNASPIKLFGLDFISLRGNYAHTLLPPYCHLAGYNPFLVRPPVTLRLQLSNLAMKNPLCINGLHTLIVLWPINTKKY